CRLLLFLVVPINLVGGNLKKTLHRMRPNRVEKRLHPANIGLYKRRRVENTSIYVRLGSEIDDRPRFFLLENLFDQCPVNDVSVHEVITSDVNTRDVFQVSRVGQLIKIDDSPVPFRVQEPDKVTPDESTTTRH